MDFCPHDRACEITIACMRDCPECCWRTTGNTDPVLHRRKKMCQRVVDYIVGNTNRYLLFCSCPAARCMVFLNLKDANTSTTVHICPYLWHFCDCRSTLFIKGPRHAGTISLQTEEHCSCLSKR